MRRSIIVVTIITTAVIAAVHLFNVPVRDGLMYIVAPAGTRLNHLAQNLKTGITGIVNSEKADIDELQAEITRLRLKVLELERLREQNNQLRDELQFVRGNDFETVTADIVNYHPDATRNMIRINAGSRDGVAENMPVVAKSVLIGIVTGISATTADVALVTDINFRALIRVNGAEGVLKGQIGSGLVIEQLPRANGVEVGALVSTSGRDGTYPAGLLIGTVRSVSQGPGEVFDTAQVTPEISYDRLHAVTVITNR